MCIRDSKYTLYHQVLLKYYWNWQSYTVLTTTTPILHVESYVVFPASMWSSTASSPIHRWSSHVNAPTYSLHSVQFPLFFRICLDDGFRTKALLTQRLHPHLVGRWNLSHAERDVKRNTWEKNRLLNVWSIDASSRSLVMLVISNFSEHCMLIRINMETKTVKWGLSWLKLCSFVNSINISIKLGNKVYIWSLNIRVKFRTKIPMHCCNINKSRRGDFFLVHLVYYLAALCCRMRHVQ